MRIEMTRVDTTGLSPATVLAALFNAAAPAGAGFLKSQAGPAVMTVADAQIRLDKASRDSIDSDGNYFGGRPKYLRYVFGRFVGFDFNNENGFDAAEYDRDNGGSGTAQAVIDSLRATGNVNNPDIQQLHSLALAGNSEKTLAGAHEPYHPDGAGIRIGLADIGIEVVSEVRETLRRPKL